MFIFESHTDYVLDVARSVALETGFLQLLTRTMTRTSEGTDARLEIVKWVGKLLKYGQLVASLSGYQFG